MAAAQKESPGVYPIGSDSMTLSRSLEQRVFVCALSIRFFVANFERIRAIFSAFELLSPHHDDFKVCGSISTLLIHCIGCFPKHDRVANIMSSSNQIFTPTISASSQVWIV